MTPLLASVIIPAHNTRPWVEQAVRSALGQTGPDLEVVVVDDGSTDGTADALESIHDPRLRIIRQEHRGVCAARNAALDATSGTYIGFLDSDDVWLPPKLAAHIAVLDQRPEIDLTFSWSAIVDEGGNFSGHLQQAPAGIASFEDLLTRNLIGNGSAVVLRRQALERAGRFDTTLRASTDFDMWLRVALLRPNNCWCIPAALTMYRRRAGQLTKDWRLSRAETEKVMRKISGLAPQLPPAVWNRAGAANRREFAFMAYDNAEPLRAAALLAGGLRLAPWFLMRDSRTWSLGAAIAARCVLPAGIFERLRALRARPDQPSSSFASR